MDPDTTRRFNRRHLLAGTAGLAALAAGNRSLAAPSSRSSPFYLHAQASGEIEFAYYNWGPESIQYFKDMAAAFEASHSGTKINLTLPPFDQYDQKLQVLLATGSGPDIITTANATLALVQEGRILDLTDRIAADPVLTDPNAFVQSGWDVFKFGTDRNYGIYSGADTLLLYYNKTMFDTAGVAYPTADWTLDNFVEAAKALTIRDGDRVTQWGSVLGSFDADWGWANLVWMEGGDIVDSRPFFSKITLNNEPVLTILRFIHDLVYTHQVAPTPSQTQSVADQGGFESGKVGLMVDGGWSIQPRKEITAFEWDVETLPKGSQGFVGEFWPGTPFLISSGSKNPDLAWEYARWFAADPEAQTLIAKQAIQVPALLEVANSESFLGQPGLPGNAQAWVRSLQNARPGDIFHAKKQELMDKLWIPEWEKFQNNSITAEEFAKKVEEEGNKILGS
ncbi:MAG: multiple sugar transport system substrate-binding protein [Thermomicrobiales bacterium]|nr:multiple sugar transport system substrate-binding protein [Thermomicrobiales bacterium]